MPQFVSPAQSGSTVQPHVAFGKQTGPLLHPVVQLVQASPSFPHWLLALPLLPATHVVPLQQPVLHFSPCEQSVPQVWVMLLQAW
jgi:hypothetical protein